ncbi:MAG TPA: DEAD/DEAH box helicase [Pirellulales bacterium]|nr:DEAD/DEAH box helicase [Pirellulales bacterium]
MAAPLAIRCQRAFGQREWRVGGYYCVTGRVTITAVDEAGLDALVKGSAPEPYELLIDWSESDQDRALRASCTCPRFRDGHLCKHIAATLLAADRQQVAFSPPGSGALSVLPLDGIDDEWEFEPEFGTDVGDKRAPSPRGAAPRPVAPPPDWRKQLRVLAVSVLESKEPSGPVRDQLLYHINLAQLSVNGRFVIDFWRKRVRKDGTPGKITEWNLALSDLSRFTDPSDRELLSIMIGAKPREQYSSYAFAYEGQRYKACEIAPTSYELLLPRLCATGRFCWTNGDFPNDELSLLKWDDGPAWQFTLRLDSDDQKLWRLHGVLTRENETARLSSVVAAAEGCVFFSDAVARLTPAASGRALVAARRAGDIVASAAQVDDLVEHIIQMPGLPPIDLPEQLRWSEQRLQPRPRLIVEQSKFAGERGALLGSLTFDYGGLITKLNDSSPTLLDRAGRRMVHRSPEAEQAALRQLFEQGAKPPGYYEARVCTAQIARRKFTPLVAALTQAGWHIEAQGNLIRRAGNFQINVSSGVDWFELDAQVDFDGVTASLPELLAAVKRGDDFVTLGDGTQGMLPSEWLARYAPLAMLGTAEGEKLRFQHSQALLLDAWLAAQPEASFDDAFGRVRERLSSFEGVRSRAEPAGFIGELRPYQREGLGWLAFLDEMGFGGCLADDMGLGKTIQVLAMLVERRRAGAGRGKKKCPPALVVVPRSLVQNWMQESARFTPELKVLDYTGLGRDERREQFDQFDLVVTTYGTVRRDAGHLKDIDFDYAILDEAQAIKNSSSQAAKACRLLQARRRLAMTGTPVENHLGELWSIFEFLNPGMLGQSNTLTWLTKNRGGSGESVGLLAKALRPFILRRTKEQVLKDLPEKTEQTLYCELGTRQRKLYDELRDHYRASLTKRISDVGIKRAKIHVLEALLRLRQAACHPGLVDRAKQGQPSAKLETLLEQLDEITKEGHKALVFSQFTSLLAIVRRALDERQMTYEYLDGKTRDRQERVDRFQQDPACQLFLISLKAGGLGLNLTAAEYVFILDPWWNPAVEAQAVDRAHRIGQAKRVFAYRLIARDTVEEKILQLQGEKRKLADAIINEDNSLISKLTAEDLKLLLS